MRCLYLSVEDNVAHDVRTKVELAFAWLEEENRRLRDELHAVRATYDEHYAAVHEALQVQSRELDEMVDRIRENRRARQCVTYRHFT